jgi:hypothetical protein
MKVIPNILIYPCKNFIFFRDVFVVNMKVCPLPASHALPFPNPSWATSPGVCPHALPLRFPVGNISTAPTSSMCHPNYPAAPALPGALTCHRPREPVLLRRPSSSDALTGQGPPTAPGWPPDLKPCLSNVLSLSRPLLSAGKPRCPSSLFFHGHGLSPPGLSTTCSSSQVGPWVALTLSATHWAIDTTPPSLEPSHTIVVPPPDLLLDEQAPDVILSYDRTTSGKGFVNQDQLERFLMKQEHNQHT